MSSRDLAELKGVSPGRAHQLVAGAIVARAAMRALRVPQLELCPWALREGIIFRRLDVLDGHAFEPTTPTSRTPTGRVPRGAAPVRVRRSAAPDRRHRCSEHARHG